MTKNSLTQKKCCSMCGEKADARGLCPSHYNKLKRAGKLPELTTTGHLDIADRIESRSEYVTESGCKIWMGTLDKKGYGTLTFNSKPQFAHRLSYKIAFGDIPDGLCVLHKCDTPSCINPNHLFLGTQSENMIDKVKKGRGACGSDFKRSSLTDDDIRAIREDIRLHRVIAKEYGITRSGVTQIKNRTHWKHVA